MRSTALCFYFGQEKGKNGERRGVIREATEGGGTKEKRSFHFELEVRQRRKKIERGKKGESGASKPYLIISYIPTQCEKGDYKKEGGEQELCDA